jgi:hypothetical protein
MPTPVKQLPGQQLMHKFLQPKPISAKTDEAADAINGRALLTRSAGQYHNDNTANTSPQAISPLKRRRRISDDDDDDAPITTTNIQPARDVVDAPTPTTNVHPAPVVRHFVPDSADESDPNFAVILRPETRSTPVANRRSQRLATANQQQDDAVRGSTLTIH